MAENVRPPVAIRIVRPYESEDELLEHELETVGKTSVVLIGAHPRPTGVILRFEVTLASGATVLRGEGRVLAHKENAFRGQPGLTLRFTRLDPRSKAVVDRATSMREARSASGNGGSVEGGSPSRPAPRAEGALADALTASTPKPSAAAPVEPIDQRPTAQEEAVASARSSAREKANATARANAKRTGRAMDLTPPPVPAELAAPEEPEVEAAPVEAAPIEAEAIDAAPVEVQAEDIPDESPPHEPTPVTSIPGEVAPNEVGFDARGARRASRASEPAIAAIQAVEEAPPVVDTRTKPPAERIAGAPLAAPADRAELLARLRERAGKLPAERVEAILSSRR